MAVQAELDSISAEELQEAMERPVLPTLQLSPGVGMAMDAEDVDSRCHAGGDKVRDSLYDCWCVLRVLLVAL